MRANQTGPLLIAAFAIAVALAIGAGFIFVGTPADQRAIALDNKRLAALNQIGREVQLYYSMHGSLPADLEGISKEWATNAADPQSGEPYTYRVTGERSFELCAVFAREDKTPRRHISRTRFRNHSAGFDCFEHTVPPFVRRGR